MKIVLAVEEFYPRSKGGTELYVYNLAKGLKNEGYHLTIITIADTNSKYVYDKIDVITMEKEHSPSRQQLQGIEPPSNLSYFESLIDELNPDIFHIHSLTTSLNLFHIELVKNKGIKVCFTAHQPGVTCLTGTLLYKGKEVCDGIVRENRCVQCYLERYNNQLFKKILLKQASKIKMLQNIYPASKFYINKISQLEKLRNIVDVLIVVCRWQYDLFINNQFDAKKMHIVRQAITKDWLIETGVSKKHYNKLIIGFSGRLSPEKGIDFLLDVLSAIDPEKIHLRIAGISYKDSAFSNKIIHKIEKMPNVEHIENSNMVEFYDSIDLLCVPSEWLETGPFVVYEAFARKVPVIANNIGGLAEIIKDHQDGILVNMYNKSEWLFALNSIIDSASLLESLKSNINLTRTADNLAEEMKNIYLL